MKLEALVAASSDIAATRSRLDKTERLRTLLDQAAPEDVPLVVSYLSNRIPQGRIGVGYQSLSALAETPGVSEPFLELSDIHRALDLLDGVAGPGSSGRRMELLGELFAQATDREQQFLSRLLMGELRHGSLEGIMVEAVARASGVDGAAVRRALMLSGDLGAVASGLRLSGPSALAGFLVELLRPVRPMLAQTADSVAGALETLGRAAIEQKLDGARIQVHKSGNDVRVFTRRLNDVSHACPEVVEACRAIPAESVILDGEAIALKKGGRPHPFQVTMRRFGRRLDVATMRRALPLTSFYFDCLWIDGESLIDASAEARFQRLKDVVPESLLVPRIVTDDAARAQAFVDEVLASGHEGVMAKALDAPYEAGARGKAWLKVKRAHTLDLVVLAAEWGSGRRSGWLSNLHLGAREGDTGRFVMLGKTFKGMTDEILRWQTTTLQSIEARRDEWTVFVRPELVVEVAFNDLQKSSHYPGGVSLRFARLKGYRDDKGPEDADTMATIRALYRNQTGESLDEGERQLSLLSGAS